MVHDEVAVLFSASAQRKILVNAFELDKAVDVLYRDEMTYSVQNQRDLTTAIHCGAIARQAHNFAHKSHALILKVFEVRGIDSWGRFVHDGCNAENFSIVVGSATAR